VQLRLHVVQPITITDESYAHLPMTAEIAEMAVKPKESYKLLVNGTLKQSIESNKYFVIL